MRRTLEPYPLLDELDSPADLRRLPPAADGASGPTACLVNMRFVKPLDLGMLEEVAYHHGAVVTIEENALAGGAGSAVSEALAKLARPIPLLQIGIPDRAIEAGSRESCLAAAGLDATGVIGAIEHWYARPAPGPFAPQAGRRERRGHYSEALARGVSDGRDGNRHTSYTVSTIGRRVPAVEHRQVGRHRTADARAA